MMRDEPEAPGPRHPPRRLTAAGAPRRVGVEIEFGDLEIENAAEAVRALFGGETLRLGPHRWAVEGTALGSFELELDSAYAQAPGEPQDLGGTLRHKAAEVFGAIGKALIPAEITCPPLPYTELSEIARLMDELAARGAKGTSASFLYAFGLQLNVESASLQTEYLLAVLRAYLLLCDRMRRDAEVVAMREILPFVDRFPLSYRRRVIDPGYRPDRAQLIDDYIAANPTRNRELDLLPLFAHLDGPRVRRALPDPKINPRPAFHYRLPNARFRNAGAHLLREWERWLQVEELADNPSMTADMSAAFAEAARRDFNPVLWADRCDDWLGPWRAGP